VTLGELQRWLRELELTPSRKLGQSFLVDESLARWIVAQLRVKPEDTVIEVGPGLGALTQHLAGTCRRLVLVETDGRLARFLEDRYADRGVEVVHGDATEFDPRPFFREGGVKFIGNLPYSAGNQILRQFLDAPSPVSAAVVMVQKEVAERLVASPSSKNYGILSLMVQSRWRPQLLRTVGPGPFHPSPAVDSSILRLDPRPQGELPLHSPEIFAKLVKEGFSQRRKQLHNNLKLEPARAADVFERLGVKTSVRAEELDLEQWCRLSDALEPHPCAGLGPSAAEPLEVVDADDEVLEVLPRAEIHAQGLRHRAVHVFLFNRGGEIYLQRRSALKDTHPLRWDSSASGHVDPGESYHDCAVRELWEELWARPRGEVEEVARLSASAETDEEFIRVFIARAKGKIRVHGKEVDSGRCFAPEEIESWIAARPEDFATGFRTCFRAWREAGSPLPPDSGLDSVPTR